MRAIICKRRPARRRSGGGRDGGWRLRSYGDHMQRRPARRRSGGGRDGGWRLRLFAVAGGEAADRSIGSASARAAAPGSLAGLPLSNGSGPVGRGAVERGLPGRARSAAPGGRRGGGQGCKGSGFPGARARGGDGQWPARGAVSLAGRLRLRGGDLRRSSFGGLLRELSLGRSLLLVRPCDMSVEPHAALRDLASLKKFPNKDHDSVVPHGRTRYALNMA